MSPSEKNWQLPTDIRTQVGEEEGREDLSRTQDKGEEEMKRRGKTEQVQVKNGLRLERETRRGRREGRLKQDSEKRGGGDEEGRED